MKRSNKQGIFAYCCFELCPYLVRAKGVCDYHYHVLNQPLEDKKRIDRVCKQRWRAKLKTMTREQLKPIRDRWSKQQREQRIKNPKCFIAADRKRYRDKPLRRAFSKMAAAIRKRGLKKRMLTNKLKPQLTQVRALCPPDHHVDHIIPLNHPMVSGLHVPWNLQYLPKKDNLRKHNSFDGTYDNNGWRANEQP